MKKFFLVVITIVFLTACGKIEREDYGINIEWSESGVRSDNYTNEELEMQNVLTRGLENAGLKASVAYDVSSKNFLVISNDKTTDEYFFEILEETEHPNKYEIWGTILGMQMNLNIVLGDGYTISFLNPDNPYKTLLQFTNEELIYNSFDNDEYVIND